MNRLRFVAKSLVHGAIDWSGRPRRCRQRLRGKLIILTYHSFCTDWPPGPFQSQPVNRFEQQIQFLKKNFNLVSLEQGLKYLYQNHIDDKPWVAITIDDGFRDNYIHAWPLLQRYQVPATIFLATDFIDTRRPPWPIQIMEILHRTEAVDLGVPFCADLRGCPAKLAALKKLKNDWSLLSQEARFYKITELRKHLHVDNSTQYFPLTWDQIREMQKNGIVFGSHTVYHSIISKTDLAVTDQETRNSKQRIEEMLQVPCDFFAYPDGGYNIDSAHSVKSAGYLGALTQDRGNNTARTDPFLLNRLEIPFHDPIVTFRVKVSEAI